MKNPLRYQMSEYDCGPTTLLNAVSYLFDRAEIPPEIIRSIMLYSLDCYGRDGVSGKSGTSCTAMMFLSNWFNGYGAIGQIALSSRYLAGADVFFGPDSPLEDGLRRGGAAAARVYFDEWHYVLLTGVTDRGVLVFDPYYVDEPFPQEPEVELIPDQPRAYNRVVPRRLFEREELELYAFGPRETREAVLVFNERTKLTPEKTVEYVI